MSTILSPPSSTALDPAISIASQLGVLREAFAVDFVICDGKTGDMLVVSEGPTLIGDEIYFAELARLVAKQGLPQIVADLDGVLILAIPFVYAESSCAVALGAFLTESPNRLAFEEDTFSRFGVTTAEIQEWIAGREVWSESMLLRMATSVARQLNAEAKERRLRRQLESTSHNLASLYEEIGILHAAAQNLRISRTDDEFATSLIEQLFDCVLVEGAAIQLLPVAQNDEVTYEARTESQVISVGRTQLSEEDFRRLVAYLDLDLRGGPMVIGREQTLEQDWPFPEVEQAVVVSISDGETLFGWLAVFNPTECGTQLGALEANLLSSVACLLGIHVGNRELYRQQHEMLATVVRALTSAIDAKDPYTCGHSDRVARISVCLAEALGCDPEFLDTIYMGGLLHDTGKIGVDDEVLRKPGQLTDEEYQKIKLHPEIGYNILRDLKSLEKCLPAVLYHHEEWDGGGYPAGLAGEEIPLIARIMAVADAYDAMHSDRPYRKGMPRDEVDKILREGAGRQWDERVIDAFFECSDQIREISERERADLTLNVKRWKSRERRD